MQNIRIFLATDVTYFVEHRAPSCTSPRGTSNVSPCSYNKFKTTECSHARLTLNTAWLNSDSNCRAIKFHKRQIQVRIVPWYTS